MFNLVSYTAAVSSFVTAGAKADATANTFAPHAFFGLIENQTTIDTITADLCKAGNCKSAKGKLLATALPVAVKKAVGQVKRAWVNYALDNGVGHDVRRAVHGFIGLLTKEQEESFELGFMAICEAKGWTEPTDAQRNRAMQAFLDEVYVGRPKSFAALNTAVGKAIAQDKADDAPAEQAEAETDEQDDAPAQAELVSDADNMAEMVAYIDALTGDDVNALPDGFGPLMEAIANAIARGAEALAEPMQEAA